MGREQPVVMVSPKFFLLILALLSLSLAYGCGPPSEVMPATESVMNDGYRGYSVQGVCDEVKVDVEKYLGKTFDTFEAKSYRYQPVHGYNFWVKVHVGNEEYIHIYAYQYGFMGQDD